MAKKGLAALAIPLDEVKITSMTFVITHTRVTIITQVGRLEWVRRVVSIEMMISKSLLTDVDEVFEKV